MIPPGLQIPHHNQQLWKGPSRIITKVETALFEFVSRIFLALFSRRQTSVKH